MFKIPYTRRNINKHLKKKGRRSGVYTYYDGNGKPIYYGSSKNLFRRLYDFFFKRSDARTVKGKWKILRKIKFFSFRFMSIKKARALDRKRKYRYDRK